MLPKTEFTCQISNQYLKGRQRIVQKINFEQGIKEITRIERHQTIQKINLILVPQLIGAIVTGFAPVVDFYCKGLYKYAKVNKVRMQEKNTERLKFQDFKICHNIVHVNADMNAGLKQLQLFCTKVQAR